MNRICYYSGLVAFSNFVTPHSVWSTVVPFRQYNYINSTIFIPVFNTIRETIEPLVHNNIIDFFKQESYYDRND